MIFVHIIRPPRHPSREVRAIARALALLVVVWVGTFAALLLLR